MEPIHIKIGRNLKKIRKNRGLSLDQVAEVTGVSKAMLGQIERGETNPTVSTLWKITNGLRISFTSVINEESPYISVVSTDNTEPFIEIEGKYRVYPLFPYDQNKGFEIYTVELEPGCSQLSDPHNDGVEEYVMVMDGTLQITIEKDEYTIDQGNAIRYRADLPHRYENRTDQLIRYNVLIYYPSF